MPPANIVGVVEFLIVVAWLYMVWKFPVKLDEEANARETPMLGALIIIEGPVATLFEEA